MRRRPIGVLAVMLAVPVLLQAGEVPLRSTLGAAQQLFYDGRYAEAAQASTKLCTTDVTGLPACELRTAALHFVLRRAMGDSTDSKKAFAACGACPDLLADFLAETSRSTEVARARLKMVPGEEATLFFLGKLDLNYVWLQLGTLGRNTGWDEYWEARHSPDGVLQVN